MKLLFLHPTPGLARHHAYSEACSLLNDRGHETVFTYNGPEVDGLCDDVPTIRFDQWYQEHQNLINEVVLS